MTTPTGTIKASDIVDEFGYSRANNSVSLGAYRVNQTVSGLSPLPLDTDIPNSVAVGNSAINFGSFRGKKLNIVIDYTVPQGQWKTTVNARIDYNNNTNITVIGGFKTRPTESEKIAGSKVIIHTNGNIGSYVYLSRSYRAEYVSSQECYTYYVEEWGEYATSCENHYDVLGYLHFYPHVDERAAIPDWGLAVEDSHYIRIFPRQEPDTVPLYLLYLPNTFERYYTIKYKEVEDTLKAGWQGGSAIGYVYSNNNGPNREAIYLVHKRYEPSVVFPDYSDFNRGGFDDRLYTKDSDERNRLIREGWTYYGEAFYAPAFVSNPYYTTSCSLLTGTWPENTDLKVDIGPSGGVYGAGGVGGRGGNASGLSVSGGASGSIGNSALGIQYTPIVISNRGKIVAGGGGGGGGGSGSGNHRTKGIGNKANKYFYASAPGSGGGGGRGYPGGPGGNGGTAVYDFGKFDNWNSGGGRNTVYYGNNGSSGTTESGGKGGDRSTYSSTGCSATSGAGGGGGNNGLRGIGGNATDGYIGMGGTGGTSAGGRTAGGGGGVESGYAIVISSNGSNVTINGNPEVGRRLPNTNPL